jgi:hypothetical protein
MHTGEPEPEEMQAPTKRILLKWIFKNITPYCELDSAVWRRGISGVVLYFFCENTSKHVQQKIIVHCTVYSGQPDSTYGREILDSSLVIGFPGCAGICQTAEISGLGSYLVLFLAGTERVFEVFTAVIMKICCLACDAV